jgi:hypothetical protein
MNTEPIDTDIEFDLRTEPLDGIKAYLKMTGWLVLGSIGFLGLHFLAMEQLDIKATDEGAWSLVAHIPREISVALLIAAVLAQCGAAGRSKAV